jgi:hypothetical protein
VGVNVATLFVESRVTVPETLAFSANSVKVALPFMGAICSLKVAVIIGLLIGTPVALLTGATTVTQGRRIALVSPLPELLPPQPIVAATKITATEHIHGAELLLKLFI